MNSNTMTKIGFLDLPGELRNAIYGHYATPEGGYVVDPQSNKLKTSKGDAPDLALMFTCKKVAYELKSHVLGYNTLTFSTYCPPFHHDWRDGQPIPDAFDLIMQTVTQVFGLSLDSKTLPDAFFYSDIDKVVSSAYPSLAPYLKHLRTKEDRDVPIRTGLRGSAGQVPSVFRSFARSLMREIVARQLQYKAAPFQHYSQDGLQSLVSLDPEPWSIPTAADISRMKAIINDLSLPGLPRTRSSVEYKERRVKRYFSAAAVAIRFLKSLSANDRQHLRTIILEEDHIGVAFSECHGLGLIPFCHENPRLRVDRRANLWRNVLQTTTAHHTWYDFRSGYTLGIARSLDAHTISYVVGIWMMEALELGRAGMPAGSFTLTFTGGPGHQTCSDMFRAVVWRDATYQSAVETCIERRIIPFASWADKQRSPPDDNVTRAYWWSSFDGFPQAVRDMFAGRSIVRCDFPISCDGERDAEDYIRENGWDTILYWAYYRWVDRPRSYSRVKPDPSWEEMLAEDEYTIGTPSQT
ncbi:hypothetical protein CPLU01_10634 [Colletotrichum plurivorum]|uniref:Uncharacterized protein n=1 Tax=Colletotrichum plurivorum TaxID=2175906 RepID=A0A8H6N9R5_9PEZI|nr:hypothetical protein CPLU01_10634 [Colletotrichum plurivorum]